MGALQFPYHRNRLTGVGGYPRIALIILQNILVFHCFRHFANRSTPLTALQAVGRDYAAWPPLWSVPGSASSAWTAAVIRR